MKGSTVADIPELAATFRPELNGGRAAGDIPARSRDIIVWACADKLESHGHLHTWERCVIDRSTSRDGCPVCMQRKPCSATSLRALYPDIIEREWATDLNGNLDPNGLLPGSNIGAWWTCPAGHEPYRARIASRTKQASGCKRCVTNRREASNRTRRNERSTSARATIAAKRQAKLPPVVSEPGGPLLVYTREETLSPAEVALLVNRHAETVRNWVSRGRILAVNLGDDPSADGRPEYRIPRSEVDRVMAYLGLSDEGEETPASDLAEAS